MASGMGRSIAGLCSHQGKVLMSEHQTLLPPGWKRPKGYANGIAAQGRLVFTAGVVGWDDDERFIATDLAGQFRQVLENTLAILGEADARPDHIVRMTWYITDRASYIESLPALGAAWRDLIGRHYPPMAVVIVAGLVEADALIEIETTAMIPLSPAVE